MVGGRRTALHVVAVQPGFVRTGMVPPFPFNLAGFLRSEPERPARTIAEIANGSDLGSGVVLDSGGRPVRLTGRAADDDAARRLWTVSEGLTGVATLSPAGSRPSRDR